MRSKRKMERVSLSVFIPIATKEVEVKRKKETDDIKEGHDVKEKCRMVIKKDGKRTQGGSQDRCLLEAVKSSEDSERIKAERDDPKSCQWDY